MSVLSVPRERPVDPRRVALLADVDAAARGSGITCFEDAVDLRALLASYHAAGNEDRLYGPESELLSEEEFDPERAGARLLARDAVRVCRTSVRQLLSRFHHEEREALRRQVVASVLRMDDDPGTERFERLLSAFWRELERSSRPPALR